MMNENIKKILRRVRSVLECVFNIFPINHSIIFESNPEFADDAFWFCKYLLEKGYDKRYKIYWLMKDNSIDTAPEGWNVRLIYQKPRTLGKIIEKYYVLHTVEFIFDSCQFVKKKRKGQKRIFLTHGMPLKRAEAYMRNIGQVDAVMIGSHAFEEYWKMMTDIDPKCFLKIGLVRNDELKAKSGCLDILNLRDKNNKVILWMPTYRQRADGQKVCSLSCEKNYMGIPIIKNQTQVRKLNEILESKGIVLIIKPHKSQDMSLFYNEEMSMIKVIDNSELSEKGVQLYSFLADVDALITDYSSVYYDFLLKRSPIGLTVDDLEEYEEKVGLALTMVDQSSYEDKYKGSYIRSFEDLIDFIVSVANEEKCDYLEDMLKSYHNIVSFDTAERLFDYLKRTFNF